jgi:hypothetical protein
MRLRASITLALAGLVLSSVAHAEPEPADAPKPADAKPAETKSSEAKEAEQHFARARQLYDEGDFGLALVEFRRAYDLSPNYRVLYNIGQVNIQLFNYAAARAALEKYLQDGGNEISAGRRTQTEADLKMLRERTAYLRITSVPPAEVSIDDMPVGKTPFEEPLLVNAGQRKIIVSHAGYTPVTRFVTLAGGDRNDLKIELTALPTDSGKPVIVFGPTTTHKNYTPAVIGWIATGALALGAGIMGGLYLSKESEIDRLSNPAIVVRRQDALDASASATRLAVGADVLGIAAVGAGLVSLYFTLRPPRTETTTTTTGALRITPTANGLGGTF